MIINGLDLIMSYEEDDYNVHPLLDLNKYYTACKASQKGSAWKPEVQRFMFNWYAESIKLKNEIKDRTYNSQPARHHTINERGHERFITSRHIRDRVIRHVLCDEVLTPAIKPYLIYDNGASQKGKGLSFQRQRLETHLHQYYQTYHTNEGWVLLIDFSAYYDNMQHSVLREELKHFIPDDDLSFWLCNLIIDNFITYMSKDDYEYYSNNIFRALEYYFSAANQDKSYPLHKGIDIGDQISQLCGIFYPYKIDNYVKIVRGQKWYGRYMDDSYIISNNKKLLQDILSGIKLIAQELGIYINPKKTRIEKLTRFRFCKIKYSLKSNGKLIMHMDTKRIHKMKSKLVKLHDKLLANKTEYKIIAEMAYGWLMGYKKYLTKNQFKSFLYFYHRLFKDYDKEGALWNRNFIRLLSQMEL